MTDGIATFPVPPVELEIEVAAPPEESFRLFTAEIARWWPLATHSVGQARASGCTIEPFAGGRVFETTQDGATHEWGRILIWDPPSRVAMTWHPGRGAETAQRLEVTFTAAGTGSRVRLTHGGWEALGAEKARKQRDGYFGGWQQVLGVLYRDFVARENAS